MFGQKPSNSKIIEKLKILNDRIYTVLIQIDYMKNVLLVDDGGLSVLCNDSNYEPAIKLLLKKYPNIEIKSNKAHLEVLIGAHAKIIKELYFHYSTLVDVLEIKDCLMDLFGQISAFQFPLDINLNFDMTRLYLEIIANYSTMMIILASIPQIKTILVLYNFAMLSQFDQDEPLYHRLCERLVEKHKDNSISELHNELNPYSKTIIHAITSLSEIIKLHHVPVTEWDNNKRFKLTKIFPINSLKSMNPALLVSYCDLERWVVFGALSVYPEMTKSLSSSMTTVWRAVLSFSCSVVLFRGELVNIHQMILRYLDSVKGHSKLASVVKESVREFQAANPGSLHSSRRNYLRLIMRRQLQSLTDCPGLVGPNAYTLCLTAKIATDELNWLTRHRELLAAGTAKKSTIAGLNIDELTDQLLPEYLHHIEEIRFLLQQFGIVRRYYSQVLKSIDLPDLREKLNDVAVDLSEEDSEMLNALLECLDAIECPSESAADDAGDIETSGSVAIAALKGMRLDWARLQASLSYNNSSFRWGERHALIRLINATVMHSRLVEDCGAFLDKFCSLGFLCWHRTRLQEWFDSNLKLTSQHRYAAVFARVCGHFIVGCRPACPEDYNRTLRVATDTAHKFLSSICHELSQLLATMIRQHFELDMQLQACHAVDLFQYQLSRRPREAADGAPTGTGKMSTKVAPPLLPGHETKRTDLVVMTQFDLDLIALSQLSTGLNTRPIMVNNRALLPAVYLKKKLIEFLCERLVSMASVKIKRDKNEILGIRRPSEMLIIIKECMSLVSKISEFVNINISQLFTEVFLQQALKVDSHGYTTLTAIYTNWYVDFVLAQPHILHTPLLKCFLTIIPQSQKEASTLSIYVEEYTDIQELKALVEVIGPFGMIELSEKIMTLIVKNVNALRRFVSQNRSTLIELNNINLDYNKIRTLLQNIEDVDEFCTLWKQMGILFAFKNLCREALLDVVRKTMPFLKLTVEDLQHDFDTDTSDQMSSVSEHEGPIYAQFRNQLAINQLCQGFGLKTQVDSTLFHSIESIKLQQRQLHSDQIGNMDQSDELTHELLIVATSYLLPRMVGSNFYHVEYESLENSAHCSAYAIKELMYVFFFKHGPERLDVIVRRFIALTSSNLLRLGMEQGQIAQINKDEAVLVHNRDSIYIFFDFVIQILENVSDDFYEECFPYALVRQAYHNVVKKSRLVMTKAAHPTDQSSKAALEAYKIDNK